MTEPELDGAELLANKIINLEQGLLAATQNIHMLLGLISKLGEIHETQLKSRQVDGGTMFYWEKAGRILMPN